MTTERHDKDPSQIQEMFGRIAPRYNLLNRLMTAGLDTRWRRALVKEAAIPDEATVLDLASGTGDIAFAMRRQSPRARIIAADFALPMMAVGRRHALGSSVRWCAADATRLPFPDGSFQVVASGYLLRNVSDIPTCLCEQTRVLQEGGRLLALDSAPPPPSLLRPAIRAYLRYGIPLLGRIVGGASGASAYRYLPESTLHFRNPVELVVMFEEAGLTNVRHRRFLFGTMVLLWGDKPATLSSDARG